MQISKLTMASKVTCSKSQGYKQAKPGFKICSTELEKPPLFISAETQCGACPVQAIRQGFVSREFKTKTMKSHLLFLSPSISNSKQCQ